MGNSLHNFKVTPVFCERGQKKKEAKFKMKSKLIGFFIATLLITITGLPLVNSLGVAELRTKNDIKTIVMDSPPYPPCDTCETIVNVATFQMESTVLIGNVPSSTWTYGCGPTAAGMLFGYYDRSGFPNMYTGPTNGGVCPMQGLGQGSKDQTGVTGYPVEGSCYIIATEIGLDGITTNAHVNDFYVRFGDEGDSPAGNRHTWDLCLADFMGSSQWKWDVDLDGNLDNNKDGGTMIWYNTEGKKLYSFIPESKYGPRTGFCYGLRLFAESRGYTVMYNYNQLTDNYHPDGFTFLEYKAEIDSGGPVILGLEGHSMLGIGYDESTTPPKIYFFDTWDNNIHQMRWGGSYCGMPLMHVTVIKLLGGTNYPEVTITQPDSNAVVSGTITIQGTAKDSDGSIEKVEVKIDKGDWQTASGTTNWSFVWDTTMVEDGQYSIYTQSKDNEGACSPEQIIYLTVKNNHPPGNLNYSFDKLKKELTVTAVDIDGDQIRYGVSFSNDGSIDHWTEFVDTGTEQIIDCKGVKGTIGIIVQDDHGASSDWFSASPKIRDVINVFINFIENYPRLMSLLQRSIQI